MRNAIRPSVARLPLFGSIPTADSLAPSVPAQALLHLNECPYPPSPKVVVAIQEHAAGLNRYAEPRPEKLSAMLADRTGIPTSRIVIGNGSDEILALISVMTLEAGDNAIMPTPSFPRYRIAAAMQGAEPRLIGLQPDGSNDVDALVAAIDDRTRVVYACTPNNPSGAPMSMTDLERLVRGVPDHVLLVVDEAYVEFDQFEGGVGALPALKGRTGLWVSTRTFSKAFALAGLRIGYALCGSLEIAESLVKVKTNFNLNRLAVHAAVAALDDQTYSDRCIGAAVIERERLGARLNGLGFRTLPSRANFISFDLGRNSVPVMAAMAARGVLVREWRDPGFETFMRISIGLPAENDRAFEALKDSLAATG
ncbi:MAG: histidinol-phosphate transaminase [Hyphomicrobiales bacterium]|jgi:histidinol-phosphate aminotransferase|nr:histidinol-phosphate transaminase [Hyphomicrobiales bacterium]